MESSLTLAPSSSEITSERLASLFRPRSIALIGASDKSSFSHQAYTNLKELGFADRTYLVNKRGAVTHGVQTYTSCAELPEQVDVGYFMVPQSATLEAMTEAAQAGIKNAVILSSGYGEAGAAGKAAEQELVAHAQSLGMVLLGPNHLGFINIVDQIPVASLSNIPRTSGSVALLSQSGASSAAMLDFAKIADVGLSYAITLGNEAMITAGHVIDFMVDDPSTKAIAVFLETIRDPENFKKAALRAAAAGKAIVILKAGSSELAARTAAAHTGALVGDDKTISAIFHELGIIRVDSIEDMLVTANVCARLGQIERPGVGIVSISGGACDIIADRAQDFGVQLPTITDETRTRLQEVMPGFGNVQNPLDVTGAAIIDPSLFTKTIEIMAADPGIGVVAVVNSMPWERQDVHPMQLGAYKAVGEGARSAAVPVVFANQVIQPASDFSRELVADAGIEHTIAGLGQSVYALGKLAWWSGRVRELAAPAERTAVELDLGATPLTGSWSEFQARNFLEAAEVPVIPSKLLTSPEEAAAFASETGTALALKIVSPDILHKSDIGGVKLGVSGPAEASAAYSEILEAGSKVSGARIEGVLASPMRTGGTELLVGVVRDPQWGPILAVALGGIFVEVLQDSALASIPVSPARAKEMIESLRGAALLRGVRGTKPADLDRLSDVVARVSEIAHALGDDLESLEINPLRVNGEQIEALDAVLTWTN